LTSRGRISNLGWRGSATTGTGYRNKGAKGGFMDYTEAMTKTDLARLALELQSEEQLEVAQ